MGKVEDARATMIANLEKSTGKSIAAWLKLVQAEKHGKHGEILAHLKSKHGLSHGYANLVALSFKAGGAVSGSDDPAAAQYSGSRAQLRPIYEAVLAAVSKFGKDIEVSPKKAYISLRRSKQFAIVQPSTATRVDVGLNLKGVAPSGRLEESASFNAMVTHRVRLESAKQVDKQLIAWLKRAYEGA